MNFLKKSLAYFIAPALAMITFALVFPIWKIDLNQHN